MTSELINDLKPLIEAHQQLVVQAHQLYKPEVERLINSKTKDDNEIQHLLDYLLDFAFHDNILILYKKVCRYYWDINPQATASYINYYREIWDENYNNEQDIENKDV